MPSTVEFEKWWTDLTSDYKGIITRIANGSTADQARWLDSSFGASCPREYLNVCYSELVLEYLLIFLAASEDLDGSRFRFIIQWPLPSGFKSSTSISGS